MKILKRGRISSLMNQKEKIAFQDSVNDFLFKCEDDNKRILENQIKTITFHSITE